jgi:hypothetical protein
MDLATFIGLHYEKRIVRCPYGGPGDMLWTREMWHTTRSLDGVKPSNLVPGAPIEYAVDPEFPLLQDGGKWRPSIFMPRWASRDTLEIVELRAQRVQEITEADAVAEGVGFGFQMNAGWPDYQHINKRGVCTLTQDTAEMSYATLWDSINAVRGRGWDRNPFCWVISFKRV